MIHRNEPDWSLSWPPLVAGFLLLAVPPLVLFGFGVWGTLLPQGLVFLSPVLISGTVGIGVGIRYEWWELRRVVEEGTVIVSDSSLNLLAVLGGTLLTFASVVELGASPIVAASVVGIIAAVVVRRVAVAVYCGAFVGMTSPALFGSYWYATLAAVLAGGGRPIDGGRSWGGRRVLGDGKTWRGTAAGTLAGAALALALNQVADPVGGVLGVGLPTFTLPVAVGLALGAMCGDIGASFLKRRTGRQRGAPFPGLDQLDFVVGALALAAVLDLTWVAATFTLPVLAVVLVATPLLHVLTNGIAYAIGVKDEPW